MYEIFDDAEALFVVFETAVIFHEAIEDGFAAMAESGMAEVVGEGDGFGEVFVEIEGAGDVAGDASDFDGVGEAGAEMIAGAIEENLGLIFEAAEGAGMNDAIAVALVMGAPFGRVFLVAAAAGVGAELRVGREVATFAFFKFLACDRHD